MSLDCQGRKRTVCDFQVRFGPVRFWEVENFFGSVRFGFGRSKHFFSVRFGLFLLENCSVRFGFRFSSDNRPFPIPGLDFLLISCLRSIVFHSHYQVWSLSMVGAASFSHFGMKVWFDISSRSVTPGVNGVSFRRSSFWSFFIYAFSFVVSFIADTIRKLNVLISSKRDKRCQLYALTGI